MTTAGLVTIVFTDLVGSTDLASRLGDVAADQLRHDHFSDLRGAIAETGGREVKTIGDALMVSYSSAADALAGGVAMQRSVARRNGRTDARALAMRVGISAGDATFEDDDWFGTPVIEASRLCAVADGGQILISDLVRALAGSRSDAEIIPLGERELKGLPHPIAVCEVSWSASSSEVGAAVPLPGFVETTSAFPFAGRVEERGRLVAAWKEAAEGSRRVVLVSGEPGVGKTRLVTEVVKLAYSQGALLLWGRCAEELDVPYQPFTEALRHYVHSVPADRLRAELGALGGEMTRLIPDLAHLVPGLPEPVRTESETERHRLFEAVADLLESVSGVAPVVLVLDDLHWADKPSLLLLRHALRRPSALRLLILATYRDTDLDRSHPLSEMLADLRREPGVERVDLQGLDAAEVTDFMEHAAGHELEPSGLELAAAVYQETQGNPFFISEMLRHLAESGLIVQREGRWQSDFTLADVGIPEGIREVVGRRLSRLPEATNVALSVGAVIGPEFDVAVIESLTGTPADDLFDALEPARAAAIVREVKGSYGRYAFSHALVRSALYEELSTNRRVRMHWQVGEAIEARHQHDLDQHLDALAHHYSEGALAGDPAKAVDFCRRAAVRAQGDLAFEAEVRHLDSALSSLDLMTAPDPATRFDLQLQLTVALRAASDPRFRDSGFAAAATARAMADSGRLASAAAAMTGGYTSRAGRLDEEVIALLEAALDGLDPGPSPLRAQLLSALAVELQWGPEAERRRRLASEALATARATGDPRALRQSLSSSWTLIDGSVPFLDELILLAEEAMAIAGEDPAADALTHRALVGLHAARGERDKMYRHLELLRDTAERLRRPLYIWQAMADEAMVKAFVGDVDAAEAGVFAAMTYGLEHGVADDMVMSSVGANLYAVRRAQGRVGELVPAIADLVESSPGAPVWRVALAGSLSESGRADEAVEHTEYLTRDGCAAVPPDVEYPVTLCGIGRLTRTVPLDRGTMQQVYDHLLPFAGTFNWSGASMTDPNDQGLGMLAARLGNHDASDAHFRVTIDLCQRAGARSFLAAAHLDWSRLLADRGERDAAAAQAQRVIEVAGDTGADSPFGAPALARALLSSLTSPQPRRTSA